jgi:CRP-like cAMP-binding protein
MAKTETTPHRANRLIAALSLEDFAQLERHMRVVPLDRQLVLADAGGEIEHAYFPHAGVISLLAVTDSGFADIATIGREGVAGFEGLLGSSTAGSRILVQLEGSATRIPMRHLRTLIDESASFRALMFRYARALLAQVGQAAACNGHHTIEERFARWLLMAHDRIRGDTFDVTQELLAEALGVHRPSVTVAAQALQSAGVIRYSRGVMTVADRKGLEGMSCECYGLIRRAYADGFPVRQKA